MDVAHMRWLLASFVVWVGKLLSTPGYKKNLNYLGSWVLPGIEQSPLAYCLMVELSSLKLHFNSVFEI